MVVFNALSDPALDTLFRALADGTRRDIVARVLNGEEASVSTLASRYDMSFAAVQKHVAVLEDAGLVTKHRQGRERIVRGNPAQLARAREALTQLEALWRARFQQLDAVLADPPGARDSASHAARDSASQVTPAQLEAPPSDPPEPNPGD
jgi:DNA-binding transcriptional ArsR family regulator